MIHDEVNYPVVVLGLGSNTGDSKRTIRDTIKALEELLSSIQCASLYETEPLYVTDQNRFINTAVSGRYRGNCDKNSAMQLLYGIHYIESRFGRNRALERRWGERLIDIDILLFGSLIMKAPDLEIPHTMLKERRFALEPLLEILPDAAEPGTGIPYKQICMALPDQGVQKLPE